MEFYNLKITEYLRNEVFKFTVEQFEQITCIEHYYRIEKKKERQKEKL